MKRLFDATAKLVFLATSGIEVVFIATVLIDMHFGDNPSPVLLFAVFGMLVLVVISGTYSSRKTRLETQRLKQEAVRALEATGGKVSDADRVVAETAIPSYRLLLKRNSIVTIFFLPILGVIGLFGTWLFAQLIQAKNKGVLLVGINVTLFGGLALAQFSWVTIERLVDKQGPPLKPALEKGFVNGLAALVGLIIFSVPLFVFGALNINNALGAPLLIASLIVWPIFLLAIGSRIQKRFINQGVDQAAVAYPEQAETIQKEIAEFNASPKGEANSTESRAMGRFIVLAVVCFVFIISAGMIVGAGARALGLTGKAPGDWAAFAMFIGIIITVIVFTVTERFFMPKSLFHKYLPEYERLMKSGDYEALLSLVDNMVAELPNWEMQIPAAAAYMQAGHLEKGEQIIRAVLLTLSETASDGQRMSRKTTIATGLALLGEIQEWSGNLEDASVTMQQALQFGNNYMLSNNLARLALRKGDVETAERHLTEAAGYYRAAKLPLSITHLGLRAWAAALKGGDPTPLLDEAAARIQPAERTNAAELAIMRAYIARAQRLPSDLLFREAERFDPKGLYGIVARRELADLQGSLPN